MAEDPTAEELARKAALAKYPVFDPRTSEVQKTSVSATGGESLDMLRYMWASNKLQEQHKLRTRTYPSNKTCEPQLYLCDYHRNFHSVFFCSFLHLDLYLAGASCMHVLIDMP
eukprot:6173723-Pleurochrysis_carterae.AAC.1